VDLGVRLLEGLHGPADHRVVGLERVVPDPELALARVGGQLEGPPLAGRGLELGQPGPVVLLAIPQELLEPGQLGLGRRQPEADPEIDGGQRRVRKRVTPRWYAGMPGGLRTSERTNISWTCSAGMATRCGPTPKTPKRWSLKAGPPGAVRR
jgi:hypothetical protein